MKGKPVRPGASREEAQEYVKSISADQKGTGRAPGQAAEDSEGGDPRCASDWIVVDCFWCAASNCVNPRWHTAICRACHGPFVY
jgi:hypothetical protein